MVAPHGPHHGGPHDPRDEVLRMVRTIARDVAHLEQRTINALLPALVDAMGELQTGLAAWLAQHPDDGNERFTAQDYRRAMVSLRAALDAIPEVGAEMQAQLDAARVTAATMAGTHLTEELRRFGAVFGQSIRPTQISTAAIIADGRREIIPRIRTSAARYVEGVRADMRHQLAIGLVRGETFTQLTERLRRLGGPRGLVSLRGVAGEPGAVVEDIAEGLFARYRHWAERVVRTEVINAYNIEHVSAIDIANRDAESEDEKLLLRWDASLDARTCSICRDLDGDVAPVGKPFRGGYDRPPAHPNCRCVATAWHRSWGDLPGETKPKSIPEVADTPKKNPRRVAAAKKAAAASAERRREIHSAVRSNLHPSLHVVWDKEGHKFIQQESGRIKGMKDRINAASKISEAFAEKYGAGEETAFGNEGDRFQKRAEIEAKHAEKWADDQERAYHEEMRRAAFEAGDIDEHGELTAQGKEKQRAAEEDWGTPKSNSTDEDPPF